MPNRPARVLLLSQALTQGGSERQLAITAMSLDRARFQPHVAVMRTTGGGNFRAAELRQGGVPVTEFSVDSFKTDWLPQAIRFWRFLRHHRFDIVHSFDFPSNLFATIPARAAGVPVVLASQRAHRDLTPGWRRTALHYCDRLCHGIVVNCRFLVHHMVDEEHVPASKVHLCYNGLDSKQFQRQGPRQALPFPQEAIVIGTICALRTEKNLFLLVEAFATLARHWPQICLLVVGSGPLLAELQQQVAKQGLAARTHFEPSVADTSPWFRSIDIFVLPSRSEAFSNSLMEAMACGAVPVVSSVGGNPELVAGGRGLLFESNHPEQLADCLQKLLDDPSLRDALSQEASQWVASSLSLSQMATTMGLIYDRLLADRFLGRDWS